MSRTVADNHGSRIHKWISRILFATFVLLILFNLPTLCEGHGHGHEEPPSFKYSKEAQEIHSPNEHSHNHDHQHIKHKHETGDGHVHNEESILPERSYYNTVLTALGSTLFISAAPFFILFLLPIDNSKEQEPLLKIFLSFASGGLLGDAFLHLIPHALVPHSHGSHEHSHSASDSHSHSEDHGEDGHSHNMSVGICVLLGIVVFLMVEKLVRIIKSDHGHTHFHASSITDDKKKKDSKQQKKNTSDSKSALAEKHQNEIKITGYMNLAADFLHNFTDGLAIGASYIAGDNIGYITTFTIFCHEIPHEIGDYAILIQSGYSAKKAMLLQLSTALGALLGTYVSFIAEGMGDFATMWILPFTAGGFIYIATVSIIPDLLTDTKFWQSVKEIIALVAGVGMMVIIAKYE